MVWTEILKGKDPHLAVLDLFFARTLTESVKFSEAPEDEKKMKKRHKKGHQLDIEDLYEINGQKVYVKRHWGTLKNFNDFLRGNNANPVPLDRAAGLCLRLWRNFFSLLLWLLIC